MTPDEIRLHIRYTGWASARLVEAARALSPEDLVKPTGISHHSIGGTLSHIHFADRIWYARLIDPNEPVLKEVDFATLQTKWPEIQQKWEAWSQSLTPADLEKTASYTNPDGATYATTASRVVLHVVNHATLHRGQVMGMIRQLGIPPPPTDLMLYLRTSGARP